MHLIEIENLNKVYGSGRNGGESTRALIDLNLEIAEGGVFALLGRNGAGKSTLTKILMGLVRPTSGIAKLMGKSVNDPMAREKVGYLEEAPRFPLEMRVKDLLCFSGYLHGIRGDEVRKKMDQLVGLLQIEEWIGKRIGQCSKGVVQRMGLANALIGSPQLVILDEPTDGLDPVIRKDIRDYLKLLQQEGTTIYLNSHILAEVELIAERVAIIDKGRIVKMGKLAELLPRASVDIILADAVVPDSLLGSHRHISHEVVTGRSKIRSNSEDTNRLIDALRGAGFRIESVSNDKNALEDYFLDIVKDGGDQ